MKSIIQKILIGIAIIIGAWAVTSLAALASFKTEASVRIGKVETSVLKLDQEKADKEILLLILEQMTLIGTKLDNINSEIISLNKSKVDKDYR